MLGKPEWFTYRFLGWGIRPRTWQGWVYVVVFIGLILGAANVPAIPEATRNWLAGIVAGVLVLDALDIMARMGRLHDEREHLHQLILERNASFAAVAGLSAVLLIQTWKHGGQPGLPFNPWILGVLLLMALTKGASFLYVRLKL
jgi:hypothetical protein